MTLGLTQPLHRSDPAYPWEFSIRAKGMAEWPVDLLYQLVTQWLCEEGQIGFGYHLPLIFFIGSDGNQWASISDRVINHPIVGSIRGLYLWTDHTQGPFQFSTGEFSLLSVVAVTDDEDRLAQATTPAHLILLFRRMGINDICDPYRRSVFVLPTASAEWLAIKAMSHDDVLNELQATV